MEISKLKGMRRNLVILAMVELIGGLFLIIYNSQGLEILLRVLGIVAASYGVIMLVLWLFKKDKKDNVSMLITALLGIVAGACFIFLSEQLKGIFTLIVGVFAAIYGVLKLPNMFQMKKAGFKKWYLLLIPILLIVVLGIIIGIYKDVFSDSVVGVLLGITFILGFAADIISLAGVGDVEKSLNIATQVDAENPAITEEKES